MKPKEPVIVMLIIVVLVSVAAMGLAYAVPRIVHAVGEAMG